MNVPIWDTSPSPPASSRGRPALVARCRERGSALEVAGLGERLLGQDQLVRLGDVEPVFLAPMHDDDLAPPPEQLGARDADGRAGGRLVGDGRLPWVVDHVSSSCLLLGW